MEVDMHKSFRELGVIRAFGYSLTGPEKGFICNFWFKDGRIVSVLIPRHGEPRVVD